jgi:hypothetical protein
MKYSAGLFMKSMAATFFVAAVAQAATLTPLASFGGGDGNLAPGDRAYLTSDNTQRGLAYNPATGHLLVVNRAGGLSVQILDGTTGEDIGTLDLTDVSGGTFAGNMIGVAEDGAIYMGNLTINATTTLYTIYRWANETAMPTVAFTGTPLDGARIGDTLDVIGNGAATQLVAGYGSAPSVPGNNSFSLFNTTDGVNFSANNVAIATTPPEAGAFRLGISFRDADTVMGRNTATRLARIVDVAGSTGTLVADFATEGTNYTGFDFATVDGKPLIALVNFINSQTAVYDITEPFEMVDPNPNIAVANAASTTNANGNGTGQVKFGAISGNTAVVYALNTNNGIQAYTLTLTEPAGDTADFDDDGDVDGADFLTWQQNNGAAGTGTPATGDANGDMNVDAADLSVWQAQFGMPQSPAAAVPEPAGLVLGLLALAWGATRRCDR